jgi:hypothetical protein
MPQPSKKDLYSILRVSSNATADEIRKAYLAHVQVAHPDRFDPERQPREWRTANATLAAVNEAYAILKDPLTRAEYDESQARRQQRTSAPPESEPPKRTHPLSPLKYGQLTSGQVAFSSLPEWTQERLLKREQNNPDCHFRISLASFHWNLIFLAVLLCWFAHLFYKTDSSKWTTSTLVWYGFTTTLVALISAANITTFYRFYTCTLGHYLYLTPLYFIKTEFDIVSFVPTAELNDVHVNHHYLYGVYKNSVIQLFFDSRIESFLLPSQEEVSHFLSTLRDYDVQVRYALSSGDLDYFSSNDDFSGVSPLGNPEPEFRSKRAQSLIYAVSLCVCALGLTIAVIRNEHISRARWLRHPAPAVRASTPAPSIASSPSRLEEPLPPTGDIRTWVLTKRVAPFEIKTASGGHYLVKLVDAYTHSNVMAVFVRGGESVTVDVPLGTFEVRYASGQAWYGYEFLFGPETSYSKADNVFTFSDEGDRITGFTLTLYSVPYGNLDTSSVEPSEF